jgi:hypothetical protein
MNSQSLEFEASIAEDSGSGFGDNNDVGHQNIPEDQDARFASTIGAAHVTLLPEDITPRFQVTGRGMELAETTNCSGIPSRAARFRNNATEVRITPFDRMIHQVRNTLDRSGPSVTQQRSLCRSLDRLAVLQQASRYVPPQHVQLRDAPPSEYGPQALPLSEAAIRQNTIAQERATHSAALQRSGRQVNLRTADADPPIRYADAYNDLIGTRSLDDGSVLACAIRDGVGITYAMRYAQHCHNGLQYHRGHLHITSDNRHLIEIRQARWLAGLPTEEMDEELTYRVTCEPDTWGM